MLQVLRSEAGRKQAEMPRTSSEKQSQPGVSCSHFGNQAIPRKPTASPGRHCTAPTASPQQNTQLPEGPARQRPQPQRQGEEVKDTVVSLTLGHTGLLPPAHSSVVHQPQGPTAWASTHTVLPAQTALSHGASVLLPPSHKLRM